MVGENTTEINKYIKEARKYPILTRDEEKELIHQAVVGDLQARNKLIKSNLMLVVKIAYEYRHITNNIADLVQEGNIGVLHSINKFNPQLGYRFNTYAGWWARSMILRYIFNNSHMVKLATSNEQKKLFYKLRIEQDRLRGLGVEPDAATIAINLNVSEKDVNEMDTRLHKCLSLDEAISADDEGDGSFYDYLSASDEERPDNIIEGLDLSKRFNLEISNFETKLKNDKQREILRKRILSDDPITLKELGDQFGISRERIRQIEENVIEELKKHFRKLLR